MAPALLPKLNFAAFAWSDRHISSWWIKIGKAKNKISNWSTYNKARVNRGSITFWIDDKAIDGLHCETHHGGRGRGFDFSNTAIETALMIKAVFSLPLRATEGFLNSVFALMNVPCRSPSYSCLSKRAKTVAVNYKRRARGPIAHVVVDATGLKIYGEARIQPRSAPFARLSRS